MFLIFDVFMFLIFLKFYIDKRYFLRLLMCADLIESFYRFYRIFTDFCGMTSYFHIVCSRHSARAKRHGLKILQNKTAFFKDNNRFKKLKIIIGILLCDIVNSRVIYL
ncbi:hypothetical protein MmiAt1_09300 [Methanimicrococcus sp. At1]|uniref:Uncharacterized protein n=1 Tax=Methanimicrococcus hacksteinii TaxID=3028293 RepID=A0ABU3VPW7_9EURY|nr:hypothetical protein [Methanimicrococcus sp. At1]